MTVASTSDLSSLQFMYLLCIEPHRSCPGFNLKHTSNWMLRFCKEILQYYQYCIHSNGWLLVEETSTIVIRKIVWEHCSNRPFFLYDLSSEKLLEPSPRKPAWNICKKLRATIKQFKVKGLRSCFVLNLRILVRTANFLSDIVPGQLLESHFLEYQQRMANTA